MDNWQNDQYVKNWFELLGNARTIKNYINAFPKFLDWIAENTEYKTPSQIIESRIEHLTSKDLLKRRYWEMQLIKFKNSLEGKDMRMATIHGYLKTPMSFLNFSISELESFNPIMLL